jgi:hypothetical protein
LSNTSFLLIALASMITSCTTVKEQNLEAEPLDRIEYYKNDWRLCRGDDCLTPTKKTAYLSVPPIAAVSAIPGAVASTAVSKSTMSFNVDKGWDEICSESPFGSPHGDEPSGRAKTVTMIVHFRAGENKPSSQGIYDLRAALKRIRGTNSNLVITGHAKKDDCVMDTSTDTELAKSRAKFVAKWLRNHKVENIFIIRPKWRTITTKENEAETIIKFKSTTKEQIN